MQDYEIDFTPKKTGVESKYCPFCKDTTNHTKKRFQCPPGLIPFYYEYRCQGCEITHEDNPWGMDTIYYFEGKRVTVEVNHEV